MKQFIDNELNGEYTKKNMTKTLPDGNKLVTTIPNKRANLTTGTLHAILGPKQTQISVEGLKELIKKYGK